MSHWTPERKAMIAEKWLLGNSAGVIARMMPFDCTRNMIIGVVGRLGLKRSESARRAVNTLSRPGASRTMFGKKTKPQKIAEPKQIQRVIDFEKITPGDPLPPLVKLDPRLWVSLPGTEPKALIDLPSRGCRWPVHRVDNVGDSGLTTLFCAADQEDDSSYCRVHRSWSVSKKPLAPLNFGKAA